MKKKVVLLALALILVCVGAFWGAKALLFPGATAQAVARDFLIQCYSIPSHDFYNRMISANPGSGAALAEKYRPLLTKDYLAVFLANGRTVLFETWANDKGFLVAINQLNLAPAASGKQGSTTDLEYTVTLTLTRESDKQLATYEQSGHVKVERTKDGYRVSAWDITDEEAFYHTNFFPEQ